MDVFRFRSQKTSSVASVGVDLVRFCFCFLNHRRGFDVHVICVAHGTHRTCLLDAFAWVLFGLNQQWCRSSLLAHIRNSDPVEQTSKRSKIPLHFVAQYINTPTHTNIQSIACVPSYSFVSSHVTFEYFCSSSILPHKERASEGEQ